MGDLIDDLLQFSRLGRTKLTVREIKLSEIAEQIATQLKQHYPTWNGEFQIEPRIAAFGDPSMLTIVLQNLLENAVKYSGKVEKPLVQFGLNCTDEERVFFVRDNGIGFDMEYSAKIYQPFERLHRDEDYPGTGIGLANSRRIIIRHGGRLWAEAEVGKGATFFFTLAADLPGPAESDMSSSSKSFLS
jgi:light-regulated signal transduction histidine kinase (bacteriophytochrome)